MFAKATGQRLSEDSHGGSLTLEFKLLSSSNTRGTRVLLLLLLVSDTSI